MRAVLGCAWRQTQSGWGGGAGSRHPLAADSLLHWGGGEVTSHAGASSAAARARALSFRGGAVALTRTVDLSHVVQQDALSPGRDLEPLGPADRPWGRTRSGCFHSAPCHPWSSLWGEAPAPLEQGHASLSSAGVLRLQG